MAFETQSESTCADGPAKRSVLWRDNGVRALIALTVIVAIFQMLCGLNADTSWLLTVGDRWLDGARLYRDVLEINPPMSVLMFVPALLFGRSIGIPAEAIVIVGVAILALSAIEWTIRLLVQGGMSSSSARTRLALGFACLILPMSTFAEREHIAVIVLLPVWATMLVRSDGKSVGRAAVLVAGMGAGVAICIKPQFAAAILFPALIVARSTRRFSALFQPEYVIGGAIVCVYSAAVWMIFPAYIHDMLPVLADLYRPVREPIEAILTAEVVPWIVVSLFGLWLMVGDEIRQPRFAISLLASLGFAFAVVEQSKGFAYHYYPVVAAIVPALLDAGFGVANGRIAGAAKGRRLVIAAGLFAAVAGMLFTAKAFLGVQRPMQSIEKTITGLVAHPKIIAITSDIRVGHPLDRDVGGRWVGSVAQAWMTLGALYKLGRHPQDEQERLRLVGVIDRDRALAAADIAREKPDIVIVEHDDLVFPAWFASEEDLAAFLVGYSRAGVAMGIIDIWVRDR